MAVGDHVPLKSSGRNTQAPECGVVASDDVQLDATNRPPRSVRKMNLHESSRDRGRGAGRP